MVKVLCTGGAGLIGSHIVDKLLIQGYDVRILDNLEKPTHLNGKPSYIPKEVEFIEGDMRSESDLEIAIKGVDVVFHEAAAGGFTPDLVRYVDTNSLGTAKMFEAILKGGNKVGKVVVASSIAVYGEGKYACCGHGIQYPKQRKIEQLRAGDWEIGCPKCSESMIALPTDEDKPVDPRFIYSITKFDQERMSLLVGQQHNLPVTALRYFVTYGPRQSLTNPYTGLCSIFSTRIANDLPPIIFEDGKQTRDFVFVEDVAEANVLAATNPKSDYEAINIGTGRGVSVREIAKKLLSLFRKEELGVQFPGSFREADVRHIIADTKKAKDLLGFEAKTDFNQGIKKYFNWIAEQNDIKEYFTAAQENLRRSGVLKG